MNRLSALAAAAALLLSPALAAAQSATAHDHAAGGHGAPRLGTVRFPNSAARAAQTPFLRGLAFLHSFEYDDAADAFRAAQRADRGFAMAYYGEALTHAKLLWGLDGADSARAALAKLGATPDTRLKRAGSPRERGYAEAIEALFQTADLKTRVNAYVAGLRSLNAAYPDDYEARALLSVALQMGGAEYAASERNERQSEAITLAQSVFDRWPDHPGGAHYLIHATDNPRFAARGLAAARAYAKIAPDADHALHMPSHIFLQLGAWDDVVSSNERSWAASRAWVKARKSSAADHSFHALSWLQYGYLQQGRYADAKALIDTVALVLKDMDWANSNAIDARYADGDFRFSYARESGDWSVYRGPLTVSAGRPVSTPSSRARYFTLNDAYRNAMAAALSGDTTTANALVAPITGDTPFMIIARAHVAALAARVRGDTAGYVARLTEAAAADERLLHVGPPGTYPAHELLGDALVELKRPREAIAAYTKGLALMPNRSTTLLGLARAQRAAGDVDAAARTEAALRANWHTADASAVGRMKTGS